MVFRKTAFYDFGGLKLAMLALPLLALSACAGRGGSVPYDPVGFGPPDLVTQEVATQAPVLGPLDKIRVTVFQEAELSGDFQVDQAGNIDYPLLGELNAQGATPAQFAATITQRLSQRYMRDPRVQVSLVEAVDQTITVDGSVRQPGVLPIKGATSLMRAVALARGTSEDANPSRVVVFRTVRGERMAAAFDLTQIRRGEAADPPIYGNDIIVVDGNRGRTLFRDIISTVPLLGIFRPF
jgi:polysaccharide biosynthesis/export protein